MYVTAMTVGLYDFLDSVHSTVQLQELACLMNCSVEKTITLHF